MGTNVNPTITADTAKNPINLTALRPVPLRPALRPRIDLPRFGAISELFDRLGTYTIRGNPEVHISGLWPISCRPTERTV
jgi:hypothetical protein